MNSVYGVSKKVLIAQLAAFALAACETYGSDVDSMAVEANELGLIQVEIQHTGSKDDRTLTIRGLGANDENIGLITLRTGMVLYTSEPGLIEPTWSLGTELTVQVGDDRFGTLTPDLYPHEELLPQQSLATFVQLGAVAKAIEDEAGIWFSQPKATTEGAHAATTCDPFRFPVSVGGQDQCCQDGNETWGKIASNGLLGHRTYGTACRMSDGSAECGQDIGIVCNYGPAGARNMTDVGSPNNSSSVVFYPTSAHLECGRDSNGSSSGGGTEAPEAYDGSQTLYPNGTATNPYNRCCYNSSTSESEPQVWTTCKQGGGESCIHDSDCDSGDCHEWVCLWAW